MAKTTAVIDIGSNSIRMLVIKKTSRFGFYLLKESKSKARISQDSYQNSGYLQEAAMLRAQKVISEFVSIAKYFKARKILCVATSALRDAPNKNEFIRLIKAKCNINIKVIDGQKEAYYGGIAALNLLPIDDGITIDIGGGSTELALIKDNKIVDTISFQLGTVRLKELFFDKKLDVQKAKKYVQEQLKELPAHFKNKRLIGIGGTMRAVAQSIIKKDDYPLNTLHAYSYNLKQNRDFFETVIDSKKEEKLKALGFKQDRFDIIKEGILIFTEVANALKADEVMTSGVGVREGVFLADLLRSSVGRFPVNFNPSVKSLMDRFEVDIKTSAYTNKIALQVFDSLKPMHGIDDLYKKHLSIAAKLCEIGVYVNFYKKSLHAFHMVFEGLDYGFTHKQRVLISKLVKIQQKKFFIKYEPQSHLKELLPSIKSVRWLSFILFVAREINIDKSFPKLDLTLKDDSLIIESSSSLYLAKEALENIKTPHNLKIKIFVP